MTEASGLPGLGLIPGAVVLRPDGIPEREDLPAGLDPAAVLTLPVFVPAILESAREPAKIVPMLTWDFESGQLCSCPWLGQGILKGESITVRLTSCLTGLDESVLQIKTKIVSCHRADSKQVKQEVNSTVILPLEYSMVGAYR